MIIFFCRSSFFELLHCEKPKNIAFSEHEKELCDLSAELSKCSTALRSNSDPVSRANLISLERQRDNHIIKYRMSRHFYRAFVPKVRAREISAHELEAKSTVLNDDFDVVLRPEAVQLELEKLRATGLQENELLFHVELPFSQSETNIAVISWDHARHLSIPDKALEQMGEHFASRLGYNVYLFGIVDES